MEKGEGGPKEEVSLVEGVVEGQISEGEVVRIGGRRVVG